MRLLTAVLYALLCSSMVLAAEAVVSPLPPSVLPISDCPSLPATPDPKLLRYLDIRGAGAGRWSADHSEIAFTATWTGTGQKWRMPAAGGFPQQITYFNDAVDLCDFSPHDPRLMVTAFDSGGNERSQIFLLQHDGSGLTPLAEDPAFYHRFGDWNRDGSLISYSTNNRDERFFDVWVADTVTHEKRRVWAPDAIAGAGSFSPNGRYLLAGISHSNFNSDAYAIELATGRATHLTPHEGDAEFESIYWADDETLYFISDLGREYHGIARLSIHEPGKLEWIYTPDREVESLRLSYDGRYIAWEENHSGFGQVYLAETATLKRLSDPKMPRGVQGISRFSWDNHKLLLQVSGPEGPGEIYSYSIPDGATRRLTHSSLGGLEQTNFLQPQTVEIKSFDGLTVSGLWYEPRGVKPAAGWPTWVEAHGGPESQTRAYFDPFVQLLLSRGVAVLCPNPRGSSGYGRTFLHLDNAGERLNSVRDYVAFRDWLVAQGIADPNRIAISGGSYGGYVVLASLTFFPEKFSCGVCQFGVANFISFLQNTAPYRRPLREAEYGLLADEEMLRGISPLFRIANVTRPLIIMQGANDPRVPLSESTQMYEALKARGNDVELLVFGDEGHGWQKRENRALAWGAELNFLSKHLGLTATEP
jgi:dipeptidyl aminopeptidase/acylaminoacyl peptidase